jgi:hypothetical protein
MNRTEIEAAAFRRLLEHLQQQADLDDNRLMTDAGFSRQCLIRWYQAASEQLATPVSRDEARLAILGEAAVSSAAASSPQGGLARP